MTVLMSDSRKGEVFSPVSLHIPGFPLLARRPSRSSRSSRSPRAWRPKTLTAPGRPYIPERMTAVGLVLVSLLESSSEEFFQKKASNHPQALRKANPAVLRAGAKVVISMINRANSANWQADFGSTMLDQIFAKTTNDLGQTKHQYSAIDVFGVNRNSISSFENAARLLQEKKKIDYHQAVSLLNEYIQYLANPANFRAASAAAGDATRFKSRGGPNMYKSQANDTPNLRQYHPSAIVIR